MEEEEEQQHKSRDASNSGSFTNNNDEIDEKVMTEMISRHRKSMVNQNLIHEENKSDYSDFSQGSSKYDLFDCHKVCEVSGLTARQRKVLVSSWNKMLGTTNTEFADFSSDLYDWLLDHVPGMKSKLESIIVGPNQSSGFKQHVEFITLELNMIIRQLSEPENLDLRVKKLAKAHYSKNVSSTYFEHLHKTMGDFVTKQLQTSDSELSEAWNALFYYIYKEVANNEELMKKERNRCKLCKKCSVL